MKTIIQPKLTVVGAGPGDPELITLKGINALKEADVILYDALVNTELLSLAPKTSLKIYVGKRRNKHEYTQEQINDLIIDFAFTHGNVVRLKGGDPFVFGRGKEELDHADAFNIPTEFIPGISSSIGVPGLAGIPVTHRGLSESFWVITGTTQAGEISKDVEAAAKTNATVVILMGLSKLKEIVAIFEKQNKGKVSVAIIQNGSLPDEKIVLGNISTIISKAQKEKIKAPAVIVIGEVVNKASHFNKYLVQLSYNPN